MLNSLASYLWGPNPEEDPNTANGQQQQPLVVAAGNTEAATGDVEGTNQAQTDQAIAEQLSTQQDDDWVVVANGPDANGKENRSLSCHAASSPRCTATTPTVSDSELLDDADSLADSLGLRELTNQLSLGAGRRPGARGDSDSDSDDDDTCSSCVRPSSPESVFSACSGRSHATYRVFGATSEAWMMAPAPCFIYDPSTTRQPAGGLMMENMLIEHPSMSVYMSPLISMSSSSGLEATQVVQDGQVLDGSAPRREEEGEQARREQEDPSPRAAPAEEEEVVGGAAMGRQQPLHANNQQMDETRCMYVAQNMQTAKVWRDMKSISRQRCDRENKLHHIQRKGQNKHNKRVKPSGFKASRFSQRM